MKSNPTPGLASETGSETPRNTMTNKYIISKADGSPMDPNAKYFMLRMDKDTPECAAAREAVLHFAKLVEPHNPRQAAAAKEKASLCELAIKTRDWEAI